MPAAPTTAQQDAYAVMVQFLTQAGLETLAPVLWNFIIQDYSDDQIMLELQKTAEWKQRFAGNEARRAAGIAVLSPAEYLSVESAYRQLLRSYGLPEGFYDDPNDFAEAIGHDMSPSELQERLDLRQRVYTEGEMTGVLDYMQANFGLTTSDAVAFFIDPDRAAPLIRKQVQAAEIGAAARAAQFGTLDALTALRLTERGVTEARALQGFSTAAESLELTQDLVGQGTAGTTREDLIAAELEGDAVARARVEQARAARLSQFQGEASFVETTEGETGIGAANR